LALNSLGFFSQITTQSYYSVLAIGCDFVRNGQGRKIVRILALIEHHDLVHAAHAELFPVRLGDKTQPTEAALLSDDAALSTYERVVSVNLAGKPRPSTSDIFQNMGFSLTLR